MLLTAEAPVTRAAGGSIALALASGGLVCREIAVSALREWMAARGARSTVRVGLVGKAKTATQMLALVALLVAPPPGASAAAPGLRPAGLALLYASVVLSVVSARSYFAAAWPTLRGHDEAA